MEFLRTHTSSLVWSWVEDLAQLLKIYLFAWFLLLLDFEVLRILAHGQLLLWILIWILNDHVFIKLTHRIIHTLQILNRNRLRKTFARRVMKTLLLMGLHLLFDGNLLSHLNFPWHFARMLTKNNWIRLYPRMMTNSNIVAVLCHSLFIYSHLQRFMVFRSSGGLGCLFLVATVSFICLWCAQLLMLFYLDGVSVNAIGVHFIGQILFQI